MNLTAALRRPAVLLGLTLLLGGVALAGLVTASASAFGGTPGRPAIETGSTITAQPLTTGSLQNTDSQRAAVIAPVTIGAGNLALIWVAQNDGIGGFPALTDPQRQWEVVASTATSFQRLTLYRSMKATDTSSTITIAPPAETSLAWTLVEYSNVDTAGANGARAIAQLESTNSKQSGVGPTIFASSVLTPALTSGSASVAGFSVQSNAQALKPGKGYSLTGERTCSTVCAQAEFRGKFSRVADLSWTKASHWLVIMVELKRR